MGSTYLPSIYQTFFPKNGKLSSENEEIKIKAKNSPNTTSQDQASPTIQPSSAPTCTKPTSENHIASISLAPSSQLRMYVCTVPVPNFHEQPTAEADQTINVSEFAATYDSSLRPVKVRCDSVLIQDCDLSQRESSISLRFPMPRDLRILFKTRRKLERRKSKSGPT